jgi:glycosyltransferase involved in cell wall biosynthesis
MRTCLLSMKGNFDKNIGQGVQRYIYEIWKDLSAITKAPDKLDKIELGVGSSRLARIVSFTLSSLLHDFRKYDIVHAPAPIMFNPPVRGKALMVTTLHELVEIDRDSAYYIAMSKLRKKHIVSEYMNNSIERRIRRQVLGSDHIIATSTLVKREAVKAGYDASRIHIVNQGVDRRFIDEPMHRKSGAFTVGYLGAHNIRKNVGFAIRAVRRIEDRNIAFKVYGKGAEHDNLVRLADGDRRIEFMGFAPEESIVKAYDSFDVLIHPTLYAGFELEIIEAQCRGVPVIVFKKGIMPEEVRRYCIEAEDEDDAARIIEGIKREGYDERRRKAAMEYARRFTWEKCAKETRKVYESILSH